MKWCSCIVDKGRNGIYLQTNLSDSNASTISFTSSRSNEDDQHNDDDDAIANGSTATTKQALVYNPKKAIFEEKDAAAARRPKPTMTSHSSSLEGPMGIEVERYV